MITQRLQDVLGWTERSHSVGSVNQFKGVSDPTYHNSSVIQVQKV